MHAGKKIQSQIHLVYLLVITTFLYKTLFSRTHPLIILNTTQSQVKCYSSVKKCRYRHKDILKTSTDRILELMNLEIICAMKQYDCKKKGYVRRLQIQPKSDPTLTEFGHSSCLLYLQKDSRTSIYCQHNVSICTSKQP